MKVKLILGLAVIFIIVLVIRENHAGVVLKRFKPKRASTVVEESSGKMETSKSELKHEGKNQKTSNKSEISEQIVNEAAVKLKSDSSKLLNSSVKQSRKNTVLNPNFSKTISKISNNLSVESSDKKDFNNSNCSKSTNQDQNCSTIQISNISNSSTEISEAAPEKNSSQNVKLAGVVPPSSDIESNIPINQRGNNISDLKLPGFPDLIVNKTEDVTNESYQLSLHFQGVSDNHTSLHLNTSDFRGSTSKNFDPVDKETLFQDSSNNTKVTEEVSLLGENSTNESELENHFIPHVLEKLNAERNESQSDLKQLKESMVSKNSVNLPISNLNQTSSNSNTEMQLVNETEKRSVKVDTKIRPSQTDINSTTINNSVPEIRVTNETDLSPIDRSAEVVADLTRISSEIDRQITPATTTIGKTVDDSTPGIISTNDTFLNGTELGFESIVSAGFDLLANSEVAKNVAGAMEIFNLSDSSLTDHIIDDPDMHSVIDLVMSPHDQNATSEDKPVVTDLSESDQSLTPTNANESSINSIDNDKLADERKCPTPRICIFWFMARNACTTDDDCLPSKICCRVRCSKQCIDA